MATRSMHPLLAEQLRPYGAAGVADWKPRKPRKPLWWRIARWPLAFGFAFTLLFVLAAPLTYGWTRDATRAEGEQMMGSLKGQVRVYFARYEKLPNTLTGNAEDGGAGVSELELQGKYFRVLDEVHDLGNGKAALKAVPQTSDEQWGWVVFDLSGGDGKFGWADSDGDAPDAPAVLQGQ